MSASSAPTSVWHDGIEVVRGLAAVSVMLFHCIGLLPWDVVGTPLAVFRAGWIGVDVFFCISGYVITAAALKLHVLGHGARVFWRARLARIVPLYYFTCIVFLLVVGAEAVAERPLFQLVSHALFLHNLFPDAAFSINGVTWSLGVEMQFYVVAFLVAPLLAKLGRRRLIGGYLLLIAGVIACRAVSWSLLVAAGADEAMISHVFSQVPTLLDSFGFGALVAALGAPRRAAARAATLLLLAGLLAGAIYVIFDARAMTYWQSPAMAILFRSLVAGFAATLLLVALTLPRHLPRSWWPLLRLGRISYGIYLWHLIVLFTVQKHVPLTGAAAVLTIVAATLLLSELTWRLVERPCIEWARRRNRDAPMPAAAAAASGSAAAEVRR